MAYKALDVAKYVINYCLDKKTPTSNLKLQKMLYFLQGKYLAKYNKPLFQEDLYAWKFGPVVPEVYHELNIYAGAPIINEYKVSEKIGEDEKELINEIINEYKDINAWELVEATHEEDSPWHKAYSKKGMRSVIPKADISKEFHDESVC